MNENTTQSTENQTALYDLIQSIQSKMDLKKVEQIEENNTKENNELNKEENIINSNNNISSLLNNLDISKIIGMFNSNSNSNTNENIFNDIDPNTILKIQKIISNFSKNDPKKDLLKSLKPFLRKSRQDKMGDYLTILSLVDAIDIFGSKGRD